MILYYVMLLVMTMLGAVAALFLKKASSANSIIKLIANLNLYIGGTLYVLAALLNIYVLRFLDYSLVLPLTSLTYVWTMIVSRFFLGERIGGKKTIGVALIVLGAIILSVFGEKS